MKDMHDLHTLLCLPSVSTPPNTSDGLSPIREVDDPNGIICIAKCETVEETHCCSPSAFSGIVPRKVLELELHLCIVRRQNEVLQHFQSGCTGLEKFPCNHQMLGV